jgi:hypothetical protein
LFKMRWLGYVGLLSVLTLNSCNISEDKDRRYVERDKRNNIEMMWCKSYSNDFKIEPFSNRDLEGKDEEDEYGNRRKEGKYEIGRKEKKVSRSL